MPIASEMIGFCCAYQLCFPRRPCFQVQTLEAHRHTQKHLFSKSKSSVHWSAVYCWDCVPAVVSGTELHAVRSLVHDANEDLVSLDHMSVLQRYGEGTGDMEARGETFTRGVTIQGGYNSSWMQAHAPGQLWVRSSRPDLCNSLTQLYKKKNCGWELLRVECMLDSVWTCYFVSALFLDSWLRPGITTDRSTFASPLWKTEGATRCHWSGLCCARLDAWGPACWSQERNTSSSRCCLQDWIKHKEINQWGTPIHNDDQCVLSGRNVLQTQSCGSSKI